MAKCRKCNAEIPKGKELCRECEKLNKESYLDSLLNAMTSKEQTPQESVNARKLRFERMREKFAESTAGNVEQANEDVEPEIDLPSQLEPEPEADLQPELEPEPEADLQPELEPEPEVDLQPEFEPEAPDATEALEEIASAEDGLLLEEGALKGEEELPAPEFGVEPEPEVDLQPELEPEPELFKDILPSEDKDIDGLELAGYYEKEAMPLQENTVLGADSMRENELEENDKYLLTPEEEKAFDLDIPDDFDEEKVFGLDGTEKSDDFFKGEWENRTEISLYCRNPGIWNNKEPQARMEAWIWVNCLRRMLCGERRRSRVRNYRKKYLPRWNMGGMI